MSKSIGDVGGSIEACVIVRLVYTLLMSNINGVRKLPNGEILPSDLVSGQRAVSACNELLAFLRPMHKATLREGDKSGAMFLAGLMEGLSVLREGLEDVIEQ